MFKLALFYLNIAVKMSARFVVMEHFILALPFLATTGLSE